MVADKDGCTCFDETTRVCPVHSRFNRTPEPEERKSAGRERIGDWTQSASGIQFWVHDPRPEEICIEDIAHAISNLCRFGGHSRSFYSVGQHSVLVSLEAERRMRGAALWGLLHDASEAYLCDLPRPIKRFGLLGDLYSQIEWPLQRMIYEKYGLTGEEPCAVKEADEVLLITEKRDLMGPSPAPWGFAQGIEVEPLVDHIRPVAPRVAKEMFLERFMELILRYSSNVKRK